MDLFYVIIPVFLLLYPWVFFGIALFFSDRDENDDDTGSKNDNDSNTQGLIGVEMVRFHLQALLSGA